MHLWRSTTDISSRPALFRSYIKYIENKVLWLALTANTKPEGLIIMKRIAYLGKVLWFAGNLTITFCNSLMFKHWIWNNCMQVSLSQYLIFIVWLLQTYTYCLYPQEKKDTDKLESFQRVLSHAMKITERLENILPPVRLQQSMDCSAYEMWKQNCRLIFIPVQKEYDLFLSSKRRKNHTWNYVGTVTTAVAYQFCSRFKRMFF